jgi:hypothetical protein
MPLVINFDDFTTSWVDDVTEAAVVLPAVADPTDGVPQPRHAVGVGPDLVVVSSGGAPPSNPDCATVDSLQVVVPPPATDLVESRSDSSFESWFKLGFAPEVADALACVGAPLSLLCTDPTPPFTSREVLACDRPWIGAFTARVTQALASVGAATLGASYCQPSWQSVAPPGAAASTGAGRGPPVPAPAAYLPLVSADSSAATTAQATEEAERLRALELLLAVVPASALAAACCFADANEWARVPEARRRSILVRHLGSFSAGAINNSRLALLRLGRWLDANDFPEQRAGWRCSGGILAWFVQDEQACSRSKTGGLSVPNSLRNGLAFAAHHLKLPLDVDAEAFVNVSQLPARTPQPALATTIRMLYHFIHLTRHHSMPVVRLYAAGLSLASVSALRLRDCQRASIQLRADYVAGSCYTSKHPKRRQPLVMPFFAPMVQHRWLADWWLPLPQGSPTFGGCGPDFVFPKLSVPRGQDFTHAKVVRLPGPARSSDVIKAMRHMLTLPPLSMSVAEAKRYSGHSMRHLLPTVARILGFSKEERDELGRWAPSAEHSNRRRAMSNAYASEAECDRVLDILRRLLQRLHEVVAKMGGADKLPAVGGWKAFAEASGCTDAVSFGDDVVDQHVGAEASSSESDDDDATIVYADCRAAS